jgi:hypothetical protein
LIGTAFLGGAALGLALGFEAFTFFFADFFEAAFAMELSFLRELTSCNSLSFSDIEKLAPF